MKTEELQALLNSEASSLVRDPEALKRFILCWVNGLRKYSLRNMLLIKYQRAQKGIFPQTPEEEMCSSKTGWKRIKRYLKHGQHYGTAYWILRPVMRVLYQKNPDGSLKLDANRKPIPVWKKDAKGNLLLDVKTKKPIPEEEFTGKYNASATFGIEQTDGEPLQFHDADRNNLVVFGRGKEGKDKIDLAFFVRNAVAQLRMIPNSDDPEKDGYTDGARMIVEERPGEQEPAVIATIFHQTAHVLMHGRNPEIGEDVARSHRELEACCVELGVCEAFGIRNARAEIDILKWGGDMEEIEKRSPRILAVAQRIIQHYEAALLNERIKAENPAVAAALEKEEEDEEAAG